MFIIEVEKQVIALDRWNTPIKVPDILRAVQFNTEQEASDFIDKFKLTNDYRAYNIHEIFIDINCTLKSTKKIKIKG